jgi:pyruvate kinase
MLESMVSNPRPTRAEASDASNAVLDGSDALMLSEETAIGSFPTECVRTLDRVARSSENWIFQNAKRANPPGTMKSPLLTNDALAGGAVSLSTEVKAALIVCPTMTGGLARRISRERPTVEIVALTNSEELSRRLAIVWGVRPLDSRGHSEIIWGTGRSSSIQLLRSKISEELKGARLGKVGERVVLARDTLEETSHRGDLLLTMEI